MIVVVDVENDDNSDDSNVLVSNWRVVFNFNENDVNGIKLDSKLFILAKLEAQPTVGELHYKYK